MKKTRTFDAIVDRVVDGDTVRVRVDLGFRIYFVVIVRLQNVFAAEAGTIQGDAQTKYLAELLPPESKIILTSTKIDSFGRSVGVIVRNKKEINQILQTFYQTSA